MVVLSQLATVAAGFMAERAAVAVFGVIVIPERLAVVPGFLADLKLLLLLRC